MSAPSMKLIGPPGTELRHVITVHIMCPCDLDIWFKFSKIGSRDPGWWWTYLPIWKFIYVFLIWGHKMQS